MAGKTQILPTCHEPLPCFAKAGIKCTVIVCGVDGDEMTDCPISKWLWNQYLDKWGNY